MELKFCGGCAERDLESMRPLSDFGKQSGGAYGLRSRCKKCRSAEYRDNPERYAATSKQWYENNTEKCIARSKRWREDSPEKVAEHQRQYRSANPERYAATRKLWYEANEVKVREYARNYAKNRYNSDPQYKLRILLRSRLRDALGRKRGKGKKVGSAVKDLGCSLDDFQLYLEAKFTLEMSFDNHGSYWQIDHIKPLSSFDLTDQKQLLVACHYTNLQPLTVAEHKKKTKREASQRESLR